ncbi:MAG: tyrosine-type recombinase/integrase [Silvibacterium sp.]
MRLSEAIETFVQTKRSSGVLFDFGKRQLFSFCRYVGDLPLIQISSREVMGFLDRHTVAAVSWRSRYYLLHRFFEFCYFCRLKPRLILPPPRPRVPQTFTPHIYTRTEIRSLLNAISECQRHGLHIVDTETFRCVILTLYATGALLGEVLNLKLSDINFKTRRVTFQGNRITQSRTIPICDDLNKEWQDFGLRYKGKSGSCLCFQTKTGQPIIQCTLQYDFRQLRRIAGIGRRDGAICQPRMHDLRPTFAVDRITSWIKQGADLNRLLPALSAYMGNASLESTEQYLSLAPERFRKELNKLSPQRGRKHWRDDPALMKFLTSL